MSRRGVGNRKRVPADDIAELERQKRRVEVARLRFGEKLSTPEIGRRLGVSHTTVQSDIRRILHDVPVADVEAMRDVSNTGLDIARKAMLRKAAKGDTGAAQAYAKLTAEHAKLNGLYAPEKRELSGNLTLASIFAELETGIGEAGK